MLQPPFNTIGNISLHSWMNDRLPDVLWAALLASALPREHYLNLFRGISETAESLRDTKLFLTHSELAKASSGEFERILQPVLNDALAMESLAPLQLFKDLPDRLHWDTRLKEAQREIAWDRTAKAVAECLFHQSEISTDIRWLKVRFLIIQHRIHFPETLANIAKEILAYPTIGDLRKVRPSIRAMEGGIEGSLKIETEWPALFWDACLKETRCAMAEVEPLQQEFPHAAMNKAWGQAYSEVVGHCLSTTRTTGIDARHDGVFGLAFYGLTLVASSFRPHSTRPSGRLVLRSLVEACLTLGYLVKRDDPKLWTAYRSYGTGQAKLAFLKILEAKDRPKYVSVETLEALANEDFWEEFVDIDLGHWAKKDLRRMSEEVGLKEIYDKYYGWPSTFVHAQWPAVRNSVFHICMNPLHRLHRIPRPPRTNFEDVSWDALKLGNVILEFVNEAYPSFKPRLRTDAGNQE